VGRHPKIITSADNRNQIANNTLNRRAPIKRFRAN